MLRTPHGAFDLRNARTGAPLATRVECAFDSAARRRGLLGRTEFPDNSALIIAPCGAIHTFFMRISIDVVFAARDGRVLKLYRAMPAWRIAYAIGGFAAVELPSGTLDRLDTRAGDELLLAVR
jgi:uncharacterized membrane protein (UPF0127 family)